jgi:integrase
MSGIVWKRCSCRDDYGRTFYGGKPTDDLTARRCPLIGDPDHGNWAFRVNIGPGIDRAGVWRKRRQPSGSGHATEDAARDAMRALVEQDRGGRVVDVGRMTVSAWLEQWLQSKRDNEALRHSTLLSYRQHLDQYLLPALGPVRLVDLRPEHIEQMYAGIRRRNDNREPTKAEVLANPAGFRTRRAVGPATVRRIHATLMSALNTAVRRRLIPWNPGEHVELPRVNRPKVQPWQPAELGAFLDAAAADRLGVLFELMALTGLRRGEAVGLRWEDVDLVNAVLWVRQQVVEVAGQPQVGRPKTSSGEARRVDLADRLVGALMAAQLEQRQEREIATSWEPTGLIFTRADGRGLKPSYVTRRLKAIAKAAGVPARRLHDLRHGNASLQLAAGTDIAIVSKTLGHSSISITADTYSHLLAGVGKRAAEASAALVPRAGHRDLLRACASSRATVEEPVRPRA